MNRTLLVLITIAATLSSTTVFACPWCQSDVGARVRSGIFDGQFWSNLAVVGVPFPVLLALVAAVLWAVNFKQSAARGRHD